MVKEIIERAKAEIVAEKQNKINEELAKVESEMIAPKFVEFDNEYQDAYTKENQRHEEETRKLIKNCEIKKNEYANRIKSSIESIVENKYHYDEKIKGLDNLIGE